MEIGEKRHEFRKPTDWIKTRLFDKKGNKRDYDAIKFTNGYGKDKPYFIIEFWGFAEINEPFSQHYSNGLKVDIEKGDFMIYLGKILERGNLKTATA
jgi:hypothetical protein